MEMTCEFYEQGTVPDQNVMSRIGVLVQQLIDVQAQHADTLFTKAELPNTLIDPYSHWNTGMGYAGIVLGIVRLGDVIVGTFRLFPSPVEKRLVNLCSVVVDSNFRGQGIGVYVVATAENYANQHGFEEVVIDYASNNLPARGFWEHMGYIPRTVVCSKEV